MDKSALENIILSVILEHKKHHNFNALYNEESACLLIFRQLTPSCQQVIMRLLHLDLSELKITNEVLNSYKWFDDETNTIYSRTCLILRQTKILIFDENGCKLYIVKLHLFFY